MSYQFMPFGAVDAADPSNPAYGPPPMPRDSGNLMTQGTPAEQKLWADRVKWASVFAGALVVMGVMFRISKEGAAAWVADHGGAGGAK